MKKVLVKLSFLACWNREKQNWSVKNGIWMIKIYFFEGLQDSDEFLKNLNKISISWNKT